MKRSVPLVCISLLLVAAAAAQTANIPPSRLAHLKHGINIGRRGGSELLQCCSNEKELDLLQAKGFDHVRISLLPGFLFNPKRPETIASDKLSALDNAVQTFARRGIPVILAVSFDEDEFKNRLDRGPDFVEQFGDFWNALAQHYSANFPADEVFFEILNEPSLPDPYRWAGIQARLAARIREGAPQNTIVATGTQGSHVDGLVSLDPLRDPNVIYSFHFYEPYVFTHQGADWATNYWHYLAGVHYPSDIETAKRAAEKIPSLYAADRLYLLREMELFNRSGIQTEIDQAAEWAKTRGVTVLCGEFGVDTRAEPGDRAAWVRDVRTSLEKNNMGWTYWDYSSETFGINGSVLDALGLKPVNGF